MTFHQKTADASKGKWRGILMQLGVPGEALKDKHGPCPLCGGVDRFRFDNAEGRGTYICGQCGAGDGMRLAVEYTGKPFAEVAAEIDRIIGNVKPDSPSRPPLTEDQRRMALRTAWTQSQPVAPGDLVHAYLESRGIEELVYPAALRFAPALKDGEGGLRPCMLALVGVYGEKPCSLHRTFLRPDGKGKAEMAAPRKMMPGDLPEGACVQLSEWTGCGALGIAEGIETAMSASAMFQMPVWSAINSAILAKWFPPPGCDEVAVFADNDPKFGGQAAAFRLAHRLAVKGMTITVHVPPHPGEDWNDIHTRGKK